MRARYFAAFEDAVAEDFLKSLSRACAGHTEDRQVRFLLSDAERGTQGKSTIFDLLHRALGPGYARAISGNNLQYSARSGADSCKQLLWCKDLMFTRVASSSELRGTGNLDGETIKLVSGGPGDAISLREHSCEPRPVHIQASLFLLCNTRRTIEGDVQSRAVIFPVTSTFVINPDAALKQKKLVSEQEILADMDTRATQRAIVSLIFDAYSETRPQLGCAVLNASTDFIRGTGIAAALRECFSRNGFGEDSHTPAFDGDTLTFQEIKTHFSARFKRLMVSVTDTAMGRTLGELGWEKNAASRYQNIAIRRPPV